MLLDALASVRTRAHPQAASDGLLEERLCLRSGSRRSLVIYPSKAGLLRHYERQGVSMTMRGYVGFFLLYLLPSWPHLRSTPRFLTDAEGVLLMPKRFSSPPHWDEAF